MAGQRGRGVSRGGSRGREGGAGERASGAAEGFLARGLKLGPRTRSSHDLSASTVANFGFKSGTRIIMFAGVLPIPKFAQSSLRMLANFGIATLAHVPAVRRQEHAP